MLLPYPLGGASLPAKTLSLTFDDGPGATEGPGTGPRTLEIAQFLNGHGIRATFFLAGLHAARFAELLPRIRDLGHLVANHGFHHAHLPDLLAAGGDAAEQILRTDALIRPHVDTPLALFRPPYGAWSASAAASLNADFLASLGTFGPIGWDVDGGDWSCWRDGLSPEHCAARYFDAIERIGRGIVIMHDSIADVRTTRENAQPLRLLEILVPRLVDAGYRFAGLDAVPEVAAGIAAPVVRAFAVVRQAYLRAEGGEGGRIRAAASNATAQVRFCCEWRPTGKVVLRTLDGRYLTMPGGNGEVVGQAQRDDDAQALEVIQMGPWQVAFRSGTGRFLCWEAGKGVLLADAERLEARCIFRFEDHTKHLLSRTRRARLALRYGAEQIPSLLSRLKKTCLTALRT